MGQRWFERINALREDLEVAFQTVKNWVSILERTYAVFRVPPFGGPRIKAVKKEQKLYFWDWARVENSAARFENLIAVHLMRFCHFAEDVLGEAMELRYFRSVVGHEVDFLLIRNRKPQSRYQIAGDQRYQSTLDASGEATGAVALSEEMAQLGRS